MNIIIKNKEIRLHFVANRNTQSLNQLNKTLVNEWANQKGKKI